jgi:hypothetical protein
MWRNLCSNSYCPSRLDVLGIVVVISKEYLAAYLLYPNRPRHSPILFNHDWPLNSYEVFVHV